MWEIWFSLVIANIWSSKVPSGQPLNIMRSTSCSQCIYSCGKMWSSFSGYKLKLKTKSLKTTICFIKLSRFSILTTTTTGAGLFIGESHIIPELTSKASSMPSGVISSGSALAASTASALYLSIKNDSSVAIQTCSPDSDHRTYNQV